MGWLDLGLFVVVVVTAVALTRLATMWEVIE